MSLSAGTRLGAYEVVSLLGAGGMGEVYRARDPRLNRDVAIKVLPALFASDPERLARFEREARTLAALNHPNIAHIHGVLESPPALVMECVEGEDLAQRMARGALPIDEAIPIARQIADALEAAHERGIVHRDLKPANVKVSPDGVVKVLDFGLATGTGVNAGSGTGDLANSPTFASPAMTAMGIILGTAAYMSPEQARGKPADRRADIWAFGVVVYEMITGRRAFGGEEISDVIASVLRQDVDWQALPPDTPPRLRRLLDRCLERDPKLRLRDIGEARVELAKIEAGAPDSSFVNLAPAGASTAPIALPRRAPLRFVWPAIAVMAVLAAIAAAARPRPAASAGSLTRLSLLPPAGAPLYPDSSAVAVSPDGTMVVFTVGTLAGSDTQLWVRGIDSLTARHLEDADGGALPFWSPDSRRIGFATTTKLKTIPATGGRADTICDLNGGGRGATWSPSGVIIVALDAGGPLYKVSANGGTPVPLTTLDASRKEFGHRFPSMLPDGDHFLYASLPGHDGRFDIFVGSLSNGGRTLIGAMESAPVYAEPGWLLYSRQGLLVAQAFDARALKLTGDPIRLDDEPSAVLDPQLSFTAARPTTVSASGSLAYYSAPSPNTRADWYDLQGNHTGTFDLPAGHYDKVVISPDGTHAAFVRSSSASESGIWLADLAGGGASPFATAPGRNDEPVWSPDGSRIVYASDAGGAADLFVKTVGDASPPQALYRSAVLFKNAAAWSPDGRSIAVTQLDPVTAQNIWVLPATGGELKPYVTGPAREDSIQLSPDGHWALYRSDETGRSQLYLQAFPTPGRKVQVSQAGAGGGWWSRDGQQVLYVGDDLRTLWRVSVHTGSAPSAGAPVRLGQLPGSAVWMDATPDRQRLLVLAPERTGTGSITVVQNWLGALAGKR